ncbi:MAG: type I DNA topoisomerase, partial [Erysipelotrichales bacterium]|nr:type I DNA topoisomerase [Erysipelotrichales bacterium]
MKLVIVESPTKVKTISKYLGKDYKVMASYGHIRDLAISGKDNLGVDIENNYTPVYEVYPRSKSTITKLKNAFEKSDGVLLATDPDREGEAISWHLAMTLDLDINTTPRLDFNEITPFGIKNALENQRTIDMDLVHSQETRRIIDRILGFKLSSLLQSKIKSKSAGRVQSAVLKLICDKEKEIGEFVPTEYWNIYAVLNDEKVKAKLIKVNDESPKINTEQEALNIISKIGDSLVVAEKKSEEKEYYARPPFTTSSLQQEAFNHLGFSAKKTMKIAQELYEGVETDKGYQGIITYMRTDSYRLSPIFINAAKKQIEELYGANYVGKAYSHKSDEKIQDAHEGIRPTDASITPKTIKDKLSKDQYKLYSLIYARALASMMKPRVQENTTFMLESNNMIFELNGVKIKFNGYSKLYGPFERSIDENAYPYNEKDTIKIVEVEKEQKFTLPPSRFSEAKLV